MNRNSITKQIAVAAGFLALTFAPGISRAQDTFTATGAGSEPGGTGRASTARRQNAWRDARTEPDRRSESGNEENPRVDKSRNWMP